MQKKPPRQKKKKQRRKDISCFGMVSLFCFENGTRYVASESNLDRVSFGGLS